MNSQSVTLKLNRVSHHEISHNRDEIDCLKSMIQNHNQRIEKSKSNWEQIGKIHRAEKLKADRGKLLENRDKITSEINTLNNAFLDYRREYRSKERIAATGEKIKSIKLQNGHEYHAVTILSVTTAGLEIRHESGVAKVKAPDLGPELHDRFQWERDEKPSEL